jgi:L-aspartate oxidase
MAAKVGVIRDAASLSAALATIVGLEATAGQDPRLANMLTSAKLIATAALLRKESRGAHFRSDYPQANPGLARRSVLTLAEAETAALEALDRRPAKRRAKLSA